MNSAVTHISPDLFEDLYICLRQEEGRLYTDEEVARLPVVDTGHRYHKEWGIRKQSCKKLLNYIKSKGKFLRILEVGCGNGWLCGQLATIGKTAVTGIDINGMELKQAERVFANIPNLNFRYGSLADTYPQDEKFDLIIFAASIQYFASFKQVVQAAVERLTLQGEIHILDSHFYQQQQLPAARQRTKAYFDSIGFGRMAPHYFHHALSELEHFQYKILQDPLDWKNKFFINQNPFYWVAIKNRYS